MFYLSAAGWRWWLGAVVAAVVAPAAAADLAIEMRGRDGQTITRLTDGDHVTLRATRAAAANSTAAVEFHLDGAPARIASCVIGAGQRGCETRPFSLLGAYWAADGRVAAERRITATLPRVGAATQLWVQIRPRPVVLVHGLLAGPGTWQAYTAEHGMLASVGLQGYAVGDGRFAGALNMGDVTSPRSPTATLPENAAALARYIAGVKAATGAQMVDLVAHSMGGLIARYYIARLMKQRDIAQLLMLGSPHGGSDCSGLASALGFFAPAALELRPAYLQRIFNPAVARRRGVPFYTLAGDAIIESFKAPCTGVPSDLVVGVASTAAIAGELMRRPLLHTAMTTSEEAFRQFVAPRLQAPAGSFVDAPDPPLPPAGDDAAQFTRVFAGRVEAGATIDIPIDIDRVAVASFALFDPSRALTLTVRGASGNQIELSPDRHGLIRVDDPGTLVHLGYGFERPRPGPWRVSLQASPQAASDYALSVRVTGGPQLRASLSTLTPRRDEPVVLTATLDADAAALADLSFEALIRQPDGAEQRLPLTIRAGRATMTWRPSQPGLHSVDVVARASADGLPLERTALLALEVRR